MGAEPLASHVGAKRRALAPTLSGCLRLTYFSHMVTIRNAKFQVGQVVRHRFFPFRGVIYDVDPTFDNSEEWYEAIPEEIRPSKDQPFYHLLAENAETEYIAYVSEQNLLPDDSGDPVRHPQVRDMFKSFDRGYYRSRGPFN